MELVEINVEMGKDLISRTHELAMKYFGDDSDMSLAQVLETAFRMRCLWSRSVKQGQSETDEVVSKWEFLDSPINRGNTGIIQDWLFRR
jgi:hypothetical protein